ncbi:hypothetical protein BJ165DRAFT_1510820 [Panaeolus papilionaceus]|nr:hypothetical protein BJ165DRAFT_1510820 [Panaeolus papilionaceus]
MSPFPIPSVLSVIHSSAPSVLSKVDVIVGPLVVGVIFNSFLYGICLLQFTRYWMYQTDDKPLTKCLVAWTFLLDTFHTCALIYMLWVYVVDHFNDTAFLAHILWPFSATPIVTTLTSFPIQIYLSWRIRQFADSVRVFAGLFAISAAQASLGIACSLLAFQTPVVTSYHKLIPIVDSWQVVAVLADGSITVLLWWHLNKSRTGGRNSDNVITRVIRSSIETAAFGAFFCIMDLITFTTLQDTNFHVIFAFPMGRIYTNTLLMTLNSRKSLREELERPALPDLLLGQSV